MDYLKKFDDELQNERTLGSFVAKNTEGGQLNLKNGLLIPSRGRFSVGSGRVKCFLGQIRAAEHACGLCFLQIDVFLCDLWPFHK